MKVSNFIDWDEVVAHSCIDSCYDIENYDLRNSQCEIIHTQECVEYHIVFFKDNGYSQNDPAYDSSEFTVVLDDNLDEIRMEVML